MIRSFRLRIALLSALLAGLALAAFGLSAWWLIEHMKIERLDRDVRALAEREVSRSRDPEAWQEMELRVSSGLNLEREDLLLWVLDESGDTLYRSSHWPLGWLKQLEAQQAATALPWPTANTPRRPLGQANSMELIATAAAQTPPAFRQEDGAYDRLGDRPRDRPRDRPGDRLYPSNAPSGNDEQLRRRRPPPGAEDAFRRPNGNEGLDRNTRPAQNAGAENSPYRHPNDPAGPPTIEAPGIANRPDEGRPNEGRPNDPLSWPMTGESPAALARPASLTVVQKVGGERWHLGLATIPRSRIAVAVNERAIQREMKSVRNAFFIALPFTLLLIGFGGWWFSGRALRPLAQLTQATRQITAEGLDRRLPETGEDKEFIDLIRVFNRMLARLERSFRQSQRFSADAAHELKTPLAILQGQLERVLQQVEEASPAQQSLVSILDEVRRLSTISRKLLLLSQADAGQMKLLRQTASLSSLLEELVEDGRLLAPELAFEAQIAPGLFIEADPALFQQVLHNLLSNAIKYNLPGGWIHLDAAAAPTQPNRVEIRLRNAAKPLDEQAQKQLFQRFFRANNARQAGQEGTGLGLALARELAHAHGGELAFVEEGNVGQVCFVLTLPLTLPITARPSS